MNSSENEDEIKEIMETSGGTEGAFCTILFTFCFILHFLLEIGGFATGEQYAMHQVLADRFQDRIIDLEWFKEAYDNNDESRFLNDFKYLEDVHTIDDLKTFAFYVVDLLYPENRTSSTDPSFYSRYEDEKQRFEDEQLEMAANGTVREEGIPITTFNYFNYFCGMEFRVREGELQDNMNNLTRRVITHQKVH